LHFSLFFLFSCSLHFSLSFSHLLLFIFFCIHLLFFFILLLLLFDFLHDSSYSELGTKPLLRHSLPLLVTSTFFSLPSLDLPILPTPSSFSPFHRFLISFHFQKRLQQIPGYS
jgi:hypothetical protein